MNNQKFNSAKKLWHEIDNDFDILLNIHVFAFNGRFLFVKCTPCGLLQDHLMASRFDNNLLQNYFLKHEGASCRCTLWNGPTGSTKKIKIELSSDF